MERDINGRFIKGHKPLKHKGIREKQTIYLQFLFDGFFRNKKKAIQKIDEAYNNKHDFKWMIQILASLLPRDRIIVDQSRHTHIHIWNDVKKKAQEVNERSRSRLQGERKPG